MRRRHLLALVILALVVATVVITGPVRVWDWMTLRTVEKYYEDGSMRYRYRVRWWRPHDDEYANGRVEVWYRNGQLEAASTAKNGRVIYNKRWDVDGRLTTHMTYFYGPYTNVTRDMSPGMKPDTGIETSWYISADGRDVIQSQWHYLRGELVDGRTSPPWFTEEEILQSVEGVEE